MKALFRATASTHYEREEGTILVLISRNGLKRGMCLRQGTLALVSSE